MPLLDSHSQRLLEQFRQRLPLLKRMESIIVDHLTTLLCQQGITVSGFEHRIKTEKSLAGKLELKGSKYHLIDDITDLLGVRIITFYTDDVDKVAAVVKRSLDIEWERSVDKRKMHQLNSFGYNSLHYICRLPKTIVNDPLVPELNTIPFELQMRTTLQHVWSTIEHDIGYKGVVHLPSEYHRQFSRLAGMLELIDDEFSRLRIKMADYSRQIQSLVASGHLEEVPLNVDTFRSYLEMHPFDRLNQRIAAVNQAEIIPAPMMPFLRVLQKMGFETLGDIEQLIHDDADDAYELALSGLAVTDIDIIAETVGIQNLCYVHVLKSGGGMPALLSTLRLINGPNTTNEAVAKNIIKNALKLTLLTTKPQ